LGTLSIILFSTGVFTGTIILLVAVLSYAESKLVNKGKVKIIINDDEEKSPEVEAGGNLLATLANQNIFLPSACGGQGTCAMCTCQVLEGAGDPLPTEEGQLTRAQLKQNIRLACQIKVKNDLKIYIPEEIFKNLNVGCVRIKMLPLLLKNWF
jgi:Na+-transporting NADH:ubiquinone oxidoreductase subunit F